MGICKSCLKWITEKFQSDDSDEAFYVLLNDDDIDLEHRSKIDIERPPYPGKKLNRFPSIKKTLDDQMIVLQPFEECKKLEVSRVGYKSGWVKVHVRHPNDEVCVVKRWGDSFEDRYCFFSATSSSFSIYHGNTAFLENMKLISRFFVISVREISNDVNNGLEIMTHHKFRCELITTTKRDANEWLFVMEEAVRNRLYRPLIKGVLMKQGNFNKDYTERFCIFCPNDGSFVYYATEEAACQEKDLKGRTIILKNVDSFSAPTQSIKFGLKFEDYDGRTWWLCMNNESEQSIWKSCMTDTIERLEEERRAYIYHNFDEKVCITDYLAISFKGVMGKIWKNRTVNFTPSSLILETFVSSSGETMNDLKLDEVVVIANDIQLHDSSSRKQIRVKTECGRILYLSFPSDKLRDKWADALKNAFSDAQ